MLEYYSLQIKPIHVSVESLKQFSFNAVQISCNLNKKKNPLFTITECYISKFDAIFPNLFS